MSRFIVWCAPVLVFALLFATLCLPSSAAVDPYEIHAILSLTGPAAFLGNKEAETMRIVEAEVNKAGGIGGRPIKIVMLDDQTVPQVTVQLTNQLISQNVPFFVGATHSAGCSAQQPLILKTGPVQYCLSTTIPIVPDSYSFATNYATIDIFRTVARYLRLRGFTKLGVLNGTDATGQDGDRIIEGVSKEPENSALSLVAREHYNLSDLTVVAQITRIKAAGAQALLVWTTGTPLATVLRSIQDVGLNIPVFTTSGNMVYAQLESYKAFMPRELLFSGPPVFARDAVTNRGVRSAIDHFFTTFKAAGVRPDQIHAFTWDVMNVVVQALRKRGLGVTAAQFRAEIANIRGWDGVMGEYNYQAVPQRGLEATWLTILRWDPEKVIWVAASRPGGTPLK